MSMVQSVDKKVAELDRLVRNLSDRVKVLERENRVLKSTSQIPSTATLAELITEVNKITNNLKRNV